MADIEEWTRDFRLFWQRCRKLREMRTSVATQLVHTHGVQEIKFESVPFSKKVKRVSIMLGNGQEIILTNPVDGIVDNLGDFDQGIKDLEIEGDSEAKRLHL